MNNWKKILQLSQKTLSTSALVLTLGFTIFAIANCPALAQGITSTSGLLGGLPQPASTQTTFNLSQTIASTIAASSDIAIINRDLDRDAALVDQAEAGNRPRVSSSATEVHLDSPIKIALGVGPSFTVQPLDTQTLTASATLPIDISGQVAAATSAARLQLLADRFNRDRVSNELVLSAQTVYFSLLRAQHQVQVSQAAVNDANVQSSTTQRQFTGGIGQKIDVLRAQTQVAQAQQSLKSAQTSQSIAQSNFNNLIGRPLDAPIVLQDVAGVDVGDIVATDLAGPANPNAAGTQAQPPATPAATGADQSVGSLPSGLTFYSPPMDQISAIDVKSSISTALQARPELRADLVNVQAQGKQIQIARTGLYPTLSIGATGDYYPITDFQTPRHSIGVYTATVTFPLYDGGVTRDRVREARDAQENAKTTLASDQSTVSLQVRQAYLNLETSAQQISSANTALQQAIAARQLAQVRYENGVGLYLEVTDSQSALTQAETAQVNAVYDYLTARAQFENALGTPNTQPLLSSGV